MTEVQPLRLALLGAPNCGKSSLFNALTGGKAKVANYPGVTVEYRKGEFELASGRQIELLDLPGVYGDCGHSMDERVALDAVRGDLDGERAPDAILFMMDASHINTHLHNVLQAKNHGLPIILVLNMMDMAARDGITIDLLALEKELGIPVISCVAVRGSGRAMLLDHLEEWGGDVAFGSAVRPAPEDGTLKDLQAKARTITRSAVSRAERTETFSQRIDNWVLHPVIGLVILFVILFVMFQAVYAWSGPAMGVIEWIIGWMQRGAAAVLPDGLATSLVVDGMIAGVGAVLIFLPQIIILFAFILLLEASGYMARAAFLVDTLMAKIGLNGRAFIPLRLTTILIAPLMTCAARWPVYLLIVGAFVPEAKIGIFSQRGLVLFGLVIVGVIFALLMAAIFKRTLMRGRSSGLLIELPSYKAPVIKDYLVGLWDRGMIFVNRAGRIILPASVIIWALASFPANASTTAQTWAGKLGGLIEPMLRPIGFNLEIAFSLIPAMAAREVAVSSLATIYAVAEADVDAKMGAIIAANWSLPTALAFLAWFVFAPQCLSTFAIIRKETNSWKWPLFAFGYLFVLAYLAAGVTFHTATAFGL
jgi:ferrous iron transport protein B